MKSGPNGRMGVTVARMLALWIGMISITVAGQQSVDHSGHEGHSMSMDASGMVMNENLTELPRDCNEISRDHQFTIRAGAKYAKHAPGMIFGMSQHELRVEPCSRIEVTFINEDQVRHQWMVHGLPTYLYPGGMFHIEVSGGNSQKGTFIVPGENRTYLVHCDLAQHMEKGMRAQLVAGKGSGDLWGVPGVSDGFYRSSYLPAYTSWLFLFVLALAFTSSLWVLKKR